MDLSTITQKLGIQGELTAEQRQGIIDAIGAILQSRAGGDGGLPGKLLKKLTDAGAELNLDMEVDPELLKPSQKNNPPSNQDDIDYNINDPENLLQPESDESKKDGSQDPQDPQNQQNQQNPQGPSGQNSQEPDETQSGEQSKTGEQDSPSKESDEDNGPSKESDEDNDEASENEEQSEEQSDPSEPETDPDLESDFIDDDLVDGFDDKEKAEASKARTRRIAASRARNLGNETLNKAGNDPAKQGQATRLKKALDRLNELENLSDEELNKISGDDFQQRLNDVTDAASALDPKTHVETDAQRQARIKEIKDDLADKKTQLELSDEVKQNATPTSGIQASQKTKDSYQGIGKYKTLADFKINFYKTIKDQVQEVEERSQSWSAINRRYDGTGLIVKGNKNEKLPTELIPSVDVYVDCSGSWMDADIKIGQVAVSQILEFEKKKQVKINLIYFANNLHTDMESARVEGGTNAWDQILQNIKQNNTKNVVLITDDDMSYQAKYGPRLLIPGCVWFI